MEYWTGLDPTGMIFVSLMQSLHSICAYSSISTVLHSVHGNQHSILIVLNLMTLQCIVTDHLCAPNTAVEL